MGAVDLLHQAKVLNAFTSVGAQAADADGAIIDTAGFESVVFSVNFGAEAYTPGASDYVQIVVKDGDASDLSDAAVIASASQQLGTWEIPASGVYKRLDAAADSPAEYHFGVVNTKRYVRVSLDFNGTVTGGIPVSGVAILSHARHLPAEATQAP